MRPRKKKSQVPGSKPKREATWKPPSIFAQTEQIDDMREKEATALKKKIFEHLKVRACPAREGAAFLIALAGAHQHQPHSHCHDD